MTERNDEDQENVKIFIFLEVDSMSFSVVVVVVFDWEQLSSAHRTIIVKVSIESTAL